MREATPGTVRLKDYRPPNFFIEEVDLRVELFDARAVVRSKLTLRRGDAASPNAALTLDGEDMRLRSVKLDGHLLRPAEYERSDDQLVLPVVPDQFELEIENEIQPQANTTMEGLYRSGGLFCTQCEAEGFRKITYFSRQA